LESGNSEEDGMRTRTLGAIAGSLIVAAAAFAAFLVGPSNLISLDTPGTDSPSPDGGDDGTGARPFAVEKPTWNTGDSWTYTAGAPSDGGPGGRLATGTLTRTVVSMDESLVNVSVEGSFRARWSLAPDNPDSRGFIMLDYSLGFRDATVGGYTWYRASDLATVKEVRTIVFHGTFEMDSGTYGARYAASVETTFEPALDVWSFPLDPNEAWTATSTATVQVSARWSIDTPDEPWVVAKEHAFTRDIHLPLASGPAEMVVTPAGTFESIPVWVAAPHVTLVGRYDSGVADGLEEDVPVPRDHASASWFSEAAKNVVKVEFYTGEAHVDLMLTDYHVG
jgi:hypothetical protein